MMAGEQQRHMQIGLKWRLSWALLTMRQWCDDEYQVQITAGPNCLTSGNKSNWNEIFIAAFDDDDDDDDDDAALAFAL